jgi:phospholipid-binding lipoprotein MlaA
MTKYQRQRLNEDGRQVDGRWRIRPSSLAALFSSSPFSVLCLLFSGFVAFAVTGCANSQNTSSTDRAVQTSTDAPAGVDDEFALLEEELVKEKEKVQVADPLEPVNRIMFIVNDRLYFWVAKPVLQVYKGLMPESARIGIRNFFNNVSTPARFANCLLQGKNEAADTELRRFVINTTAGVLGFGDPALDQYGLKPVHEDLGQTLAVYGLGDGFYIVWPLFGPSTARDTVGMVGDQFLNPLRYVDPRDVSIGISVVKVTNAGSFQIGKYEDFKAEAFEPYVAMRELYIQYRHKQIRE